MQYNYSISLLPPIVLVNLFGALLQQSFLDYVLNHNINILCIICNLLHVNNIIYLHITQYMGLDMEAYYLMSILQADRLVK